MDELIILLIGGVIVGVVGLVGYLSDQKTSQKQAVQNGANNDIDEED